MVAALVALVVLLAGEVALAAVDPGVACARAKVQAVKAMEDSQLRCQSTAVLEGTFVDGFCLNEAHFTLVAEFLANDGAGGCATTDDGPDIAERVQQFTGIVASSLRSGSTASRCAANRMRAAARYARRSLHHRARSALHDGEVLPELVATLAARLRSAFARAEGHGDCVTQTDADATIATTDAFVVAVVGRLIPRCGDVVAAASEECDGADSLACEGRCQADCTCPPPICGNEVIENGEHCDGTAPGTCLDVGGRCGGPAEPDACLCCGEQICAPGLECCDGDVCFMSRLGLGLCVPPSCSLPSECPIPLSDCQDGHCCGPAGAICAIEGFVFDGCCPGLVCTGTPTFSSCAPP